MKTISLSLVILTIFCLNSYAASPAIEYVPGGKISFPVEKINKSADQVKRLESLLGGCLYSEVINSLDPKLSFIPPAPNTKPYIFDGAGSTFEEQRSGTKTTVKTKLYPESSHSVKTLEYLDLAGKKTRIRSFEAHISHDLDEKTKADVLLASLTHDIANGLAVDLYITSPTPTIILAKDTETKCVVDDWGRQTCEEVEGPYSAFDLQIPVDFQETAKWMNAETDLASKKVFDFRKLIQCYESNINQML